MRCHHPLWPDGARRQSLQCGAVTQFLDEVWANKVLGQQNSSFEESDQADVYPIEFPGLPRSNILLDAVKMTGT